MFDSPYVKGFVGALILALCYEAYVDHMRVKKTCANIVAATAGKFTCDF